MMRLNSKALACAGATAIAFAAIAAPVSAADDAIKMGVVSFLSGPGAGPFGVPSRNGAELVINAINAGKLPAPYDTAGMAGRSIAAEFVDESGGNTKQVAEYRNLVQKRGMQVMLGYISSGSCAALAPVAEELKTLTVMAICGTPRVFEETSRKYVFRTMSHATADSVAAARYIATNYPDVKAYTGINQNYAWGQDSWRDFDLAMQALTKAKASEKPQWPKIFQGQYSSEISALSLDKSDLLHSSFWDGDLEALIFQGQTRGLFQRKKVLLTVGGTASYRLGKRMPDGVILGGRGPYGILVRGRDTALNNWFVNAYKDRYGTYPSGPAYQYAQAVLATKLAFDKAGSVEVDAVIKAFEGLVFESFSTNVSMTLAGGHQAVTEHVYGLSKYNDETGEPGVEKLSFYPAECVMPPDGVSSVDWIRSGMNAAGC